MRVALRTTSGQTLVSFPGGGSKPPLAAPLQACGQ